MTVVRHERNCGLAAARNTAFRTARGEFVASLDADCIAEPTWLENLAPHLNHAKVAGAGGFLREGVQSAIADRWRRAHMPQEWGATPVRNPRFLFGCNNIFRRTAVLDAGGYDETMRTNGEDCELSRQLYAKSWELIYDPAAQATHWRSDSVKSILDTYWRWWKSGVNAYASGISFRSVVGQALSVHFRHTFWELVRSDLKAPRFELLSVDILLLAYLPYRDFSAVAQINGSPVSQRSSAGA